MRLSKLFVGLVALSLTMPILTGCENEEVLEKEQDIKVKDDGTVVSETEKTTRTDDGAIKKTEEKTVDRDND